MFLAILLYNLGMDIKELISESLKNAFSKSGFDESLAILQNSYKPEICDFQCNSAFQIAKKQGENVFQVVEKILQNIEGLDDYVETFFAPPGFINFKLKDKAYDIIANNLLTDPLCGVKKHETSKKILFDYGGANEAKELHIGHLRSPIIGEALKRLYMLLGDQAASDVHLGDWGMPIGLVIAQLEEDGFLDFYFKGTGEKKQITIDDLNYAYPKASQRKKNEPDFAEKAHQFTVKFQNKQEPYYTIWKEIDEVSKKDIKKFYDKLGADFDFWFGESTASDYIPKVLEIFKQKNLLKQSDGALIVEVANENENIETGKFDASGKPLLKNPMPPIILKKSDGADNYDSSELGTILMRNETGKWDELFYITDDRQGMHFRQCFRAAKLAGISPENQTLTHVSFGTICGQDGKPFKTRSGDTVKLNDVMEIVEAKVDEKLKENGTQANEKLKEIISLGALKFGDLSNEISKNYVLDFDKFTSFDGKTGPYLQYTMARINSILLKAGTFSEEIDIQTSEEREIVKEILKLADSYETCYQNKTLHTLCAQAYNVASAFSTFYNNIKILSESKEKRRASLLSICRLVYKALKQVLWTLAIEIPERM